MELSRRESLGAIAYVLGLGTLAAYVWSEFEAHRGQVIEKKVVSYSPNTSSEILTISKNGSKNTNSDTIEPLTNKTSNEINSTDMDKIESKHQNIRFEMTIQVYNDQSPKSRTVYSTSRELFNQAAPGDYVSFQISISESTELVGFSCIESNRSSLESTCQYDSENNSF